LKNKRIRLTTELPVEARHGCKVGNIYDVEDEVRLPPKGGNNQGRLKKVGFRASSGVIVYAIRGEFEWYDDRSA